MSRNKYPEQSRTKILDVAQRLFAEQGYDNTTIQNIVDDLGGMTKGVIYHHFKSKKAIFDAVTARMAGDSDGRRWYENWPGKTGLDKLQRALIQSLSEYQRYDVAYSAEVMLKDPRVIGEMYQANLTDNVAAIEQYVQEGVDDGSIPANDVHELAEFIIVTLNLWIGLRFPTMSRAEITAKFELLQSVFDGIGIHLISTKVIATAEQLYDQLH